MTSDPEMIVVTEEFCNACRTPRVSVHHQSFPELQVRGESPKRAARELVIRLKSNLDAVSDPPHRERVHRAIADAQSYLTKNEVPELKLNEIIDVLSAAPAKPGAQPSILAKTETLEVRRLTLPKGRDIPTHYAQGEMTVHCLEGRIAFTADGVEHEMGPGQLIVLAPRELHSLVGLEDSSVLVTKVLLVQSTTRDLRETSRDRETIADVFRANAPQA